MKKCEKTKRNDSHYIFFGLEIETVKNVSSHFPVKNQVRKKIYEGFFDSIHCIIRRCKKILISGDELIFLHKLIASLGVGVEKYESTSLLLVDTALKIVSQLFCT